MNVKAALGCMHTRRLCAWKDAANALASPHQLQLFSFFPHSVLTDHATNRCNVVAPIWLYFPGHICPLTQTEPSFFFILRHPCLIHVAPFHNGCQHRPFNPATCHCRCVHCRSHYLYPVCSDAHLDQDLCQSFDHWLGWLWVTSSLSPSRSSDLSFLHVTDAAIATLVRTSLC